MVKVPLPLNAGTKRKHKTQAQNATTKRKHKTQARNASTKRKHETQALMGATRLASGKMQCSYTISKGSQTARITLMSVSLCHKNPDAGRVAPISGSVWW